MWYHGVDVAYRRLSDWTRLQWALPLHTQRASPFSAVRGGDAALHKLLRDLVLIVCARNVRVLLSPSCPIHTAEVELRRDSGVSWVLVDSASGQ